MTWFGWCRGIEDAGLLREAGFDYIECAVTALRLEDDDAFRAELPRYLDSPLPVRAFNLLFPGDMRLVGPDVDGERVTRYVAKTAAALGRIGARIVVFGSGKARFVPEGWERQAAEEQLLGLLERIAGEFAGTGVTLAIEPLNRGETNLINSVEEACRFASAVNREPVRVLADLYHMELEREPYETLVRHRDWLAHIHVADTGRLSPGTGSYPYAEFAGRLREAGYDGMISAECRVSEHAEFADGRDYMQRMFRWDRL